MSEGLKRNKKAAFILTNGLWIPNIDVTDRKDDDDYGSSRPLTHSSVFQFLSPP